DLALDQALAQVLGADVEVDYLVGVGHDPIGNRFANGHADGTGDDVVQRFDVLDVDGSDYADAFIEQQLDVLPSLLVERARHVGMGDIVDDRTSRCARNHSFDVHFLQCDTTIPDLAAWHDLNVF